MKIEKDILIVVNGDANNPIVYSETVDSFLTTSIFRAVRELKLSMTDSDMEDVVDALNSGSVYWWQETYCFTKI